MPAWFSDALCRLATGSRFATRMLHTDRDEVIFAAARPIVLNGITSLTDRADLADRAIAPVSTGGPQPPRSIDRE